MATKRAEGIQIDEDRAHQRREWRLERVGWAVMALLLAAGLLGVLGDGPLARAHAGGDGPVSLDYDRLQRAKAPTDYRFELDPALAGDGTVRLRFEDSLLEEVELDAIVPEPDTVRSGPGFVEFEFAMAPGTGRPARIVFEFQPTSFGRVAGRIGVEGAPPFAIDQFVFP